MKMIKTILFLSIGLYLLQSQARADFSFESLEQRFKNLVMLVAGESWVEKFWGPQDNIELPEIPNVIEKSTDTKTYDKSAIELRTVKGLTSEIKQKLDQAFIEEAIQVILNRSSSETEVSTWLNTLNQGGSREGVYRGIVLGEEYLGKEEVPGTLSDASKSFFAEYMQTYLARNPSESFLNETNLYITKRLVIEKTLDVMDAFIKEEDLMSWYAVLSSDLAIRFPNIYKSKLRSNKSKKIHYDWSAGVPYEHIQSEVIIKLHSAFNSLEQ